MGKKSLKDELKDIKLILTDKEKFNQQVFEQYKDSLNDFSDLIGDGYDGMSNLFYLINRKYLHWLDNDPDKSVLKDEVLFRRKFYKVLQKVGPSMLGCAQVIENRKRLDNPEYQGEDDKVILPDRPVIFVSNHGIRDDVLASVLAANRHAYLYCGSLPLFYNSFNGFATSLVGQIMVNRKNKNSRLASIDKSLRAMEYGADMIIFPEGGWNKTKENLVLDLWKGFYLLSKEGKYDVVPITHYVRDMEIVDKKNTLHTVVDDPIPLYEMTEDEAINYIRDNFATWEYKMAERYGQSTRSEELKGFNSSDEKWADHLEKRMVHVDRYDSSIEKVADYRPKDKIRIEDVFEPISNVENINPDNINIVSDAKRLVREKKNTDFQRRY